MVMRESSSHPSPHFLEGGRILHRAGGEGYEAGRERQFAGLVTFAGDSDILVG
jgi:hypothetical protein